MAEKVKDPSIMLPLWVEIRAPMQSFVDRNDAKAIAAALHEQGASLSVWSDDDEELYGKAAHFLDKTAYSPTRRLASIRRQLDRLRMEYTEEFLLQKVAENAQIVRGKIERRCDRAFQARMPGSKKPKMQSSERRRPPRSAMVDGQLFVLPRSKYGRWVIYEGGRVFIPWGIRGDQIAEYMKSGT